MKYLIFTLQISFLFATQATFSQSGQLDKTFGDTGIVTNHEIGCDALCLQTDQKIILAGYSHEKFKVSRYKTDGSIDESFGEKGYTADRFGSLQATAVVTDDADNIFVTGGFNDINIIKYTKEGKVDSTFGTNGLQLTDLGQYEFPYDIKLQSDDKIIIAGITYDDPFNPQIRIFITRFNANGSLDLSFGKNGYVINAATISRYSIAKLIIQPDAKIIVGGSINQGDADFFLSRYNNDGSTDKSFGINGNVITRFSNNEDYLNALILQTDGKIIAGGQGNYFVLGNKLGNMLVVQYNIDGTIDNNFGNQGSTVISFGENNSSIHDLLLQNDNKIVATGYVADRDQTFEKFALARIDKYGHADSTFGSSGTQATAIGYFAIPSGAALQTNNKIIVGGNVFAGLDNYSAVARYNIENQKQIIVAKIKRWIHHHNGIEWDYMPDPKSYTVQKSVNRTDWMTVYHPSLIADNQYIDGNASVGTNYYRLQAKSNDGIISNSNIITIINTDLKIRLSPNPANNNLLIQGLPTSSTTKISITDFSGNLKKQASTTTAIVNLNIASLKSGNYLLKIVTPDEVISNQFIKQ